MYLSLTLFVSLWACHFTSIAKYMYSGSVLYSFFELRGVDLPLFEQNFNFNFFLLNIFYYWSLMDSIAFLCHMESFWSI
jgi:hypothetical protein